SAVQYSASLETTSVVRANEITTKFSHTRPDGTDWYTVNANLQYGENLAEGYNTADDVVNAWMASPTHRANILKPDFKTCAISTTTQNGRTYWAQEFGI
ncbi:Cysteine-rich secretory protein family protein, partial [Oribacterium sp. KHPX15]|uniref:CAP domain-containing protein n=1 Tax=Oribacterium sp. KHPX15 TaxID=1855342 RepID=UPI000895D724